jgi:hypothetical protein
MIQYQTDVTNTFHAVSTATIRRVNLSSPVRAQRAASAVRSPAVSSYGETTFSTEPLPIRPTHDKM